mgnify:CR=1 FL=1
METTLIQNSEGGVIGFEHLNDGRYKISMAADDGERIRYLCCYLSVHDMLAFKKSVSEIINISEDE